MSRISAKQLLALNKKYIPVDATWYLPNAGRNGHAEYIQERLPGAVFFDLDKIKAESPYPHMMPSKEQFEKGLSDLGITPSDLLVVYDKQNIFSSPRVLWMLQTFKHPNALLLDNFGDYKHLGGPLESGEPKPIEASQYKAAGEPGEWILFEQLKDIVTNGDIKNYHVLDARPEGRFNGTASEPRPGMPSGHVPGSQSLPFSAVVQDGHFKSPEELKPLLESKGVLDGKPVIVMCGTGVTACVIKQAIDPLLNQPAKVYDGSWTEWALRAPEIIEVTK